MAARLEDIVAAAPFMPMFSSIVCLRTNLQPMSLAEVTMHVKVQNGTEKKGTLCKNVDELSGTSLAFRRLAHTRVSYVANPAGLRRLFPFPDLRQRITQEARCRSGRKLLRSKRCKHQ